MIPVSWTLFFTGYLVSRSSHLLHLVAALAFGFLDMCFCSHLYSCISALAMLTFV